MDIFIFNDSETKKTVCGSIGRYSNELGTLINTNFSFPLNMILDIAITYNKRYILNQALLFNLRFDIECLNVGLSLKQKGFSNFNNKQPVMPLLYPFGKC